VVSGPFRIEWFVWAQTAAYFIVMVLSFIIVIRRGGVSKVRPDARVLNSIIITGLPFALVAFAMTLYWRIDAVLIERLLPDGALQAGIYAQAFRLFDAFAMIPVMFGGLLLPIMSKELAADSDIKPLASMAGRMLLAPLGVGAVTLATFPGEILDLLYISPARGAVNAFTVLMLTLVPVGVVYIFSTMLTAAGRLKLLGIITLGGMVINILMNLVLIPAFSAAGAACAAFCTQMIVALACVIAVEKNMVKMVVPGRLFLYLLMLLLTFAVGQLMKLLEVPWVMAAAAELIAGMALALVFRMIEPLKNLKLIVQRRDSI
jgi:O-antigen/teichoic acid export membrane protein